MGSSAIPDWVTFPEADWTDITPAQAGLEVDAYHEFIGGLAPTGASFGGEDHSGNKWGVAVTRGGHMLKTWGDPSYRFQTASVGKAFARALFGLAVQEGMVEGTDLISLTWTGEDELSHPHKYLTEGYHKTLTWNHLLGPRDGDKHYGGFPIELGNDWRAHGRGASALGWEFPSWANWTGDPSYDLYAQVEPGTVGLYSSGGFWRLGQALTALWRRDLKDVLDERLFGKIGIPPERWDWYSGKDVKSQKDFYPSIPGSYTYLDPPYEIQGHVVRSAPGWVVISAEDLARFGHLVATGGVWKGERILDPEWLRGHGGGNKCGVSGEGTHYTAIGMVTTVGIKHPFTVTKESFLPERLFLGPVNL